MPKPCRPPKPSPPYRRRWQIEIAFKRLKSVAGLDTLQAKEERLVRAAIWAKLILATTRNLAEPPRQRRYQWTRLNELVS